MPVFADDQLVFWSVNRSHQSDIGGATHGAYNPGATEIWQEGIRITPLKLHDRGVVREDVLQMIATNVRHPRDFRGDLAAMIGSARVGERRMLALLAEYGQPLALAAVEGVLDGAERQARACIAEWKDGVYRGEAIVDDDGHGFEDIWIRATVSKRGSDVTVDLSDSHPQVRGFINSSYPNMRAAVCMALAYLIDPHTPKNDGAFRSLSVVAREGTVVWARPGAPVTLCTNHCAQEIMEAVIKALAPACPVRAMAGWGRRFRIAIQGKIPARGGPSSGTCSMRGREARFLGRRRLAHRRRVAGGRRHQVRQRRGHRGALPALLPAPRVPRRFGGDGRYRGGVGTSMELGVEIDQPARANTAGDGVRHGACGLFGGADGLPHHYVLKSRGRPDRVLRTKEVGITIRPGDMIHVESGGGGGWGDPRQRAATARHEDAGPRLRHRQPEAEAPPPGPGRGAPCPRAAKASRARRGPRLPRSRDPRRTGRRARFRMSETESKATLPSPSPWSGEGGGEGRALHDRVGRSCAARHPRPLFSPEGTV